MTDLSLERRVAMARLEAALSQSGFSMADDVVVRIAANEDANDVARALGDVSIAPDDSGNQSGISNVVKLMSYFPSADHFTHASAPASAIEVPDDVLKILSLIRGKLLQEMKGGGPESNLNPREVGWSLSVEKDRRKSVTSLVMRICTARAVRKALKLDKYGQIFSAALGLPVRLEVGMLAQSHVDRWAHTGHTSIAAGMSVGPASSNGNDLGATVTIPVRPRPGGGDRVNDDRQYHFITVAHAFHDFSAAEPQSDVSDQNPAIQINDRLVAAEHVDLVRQPAPDQNPNRVIGAVQQKEYSHFFDAVNFIDGALVSSSNIASLEFGKSNRYQIGGIWKHEILPENKVFMYGSTSGMVPVSVETGPDTRVTVLSPDGTRLIYRDMIEFVHDNDVEKPATVAGDSGAALLVRSDGRYYVAGMVVGGGSRSGKARRARSYAVPIGRVLDKFNVDLW